MTRRTPLKRSIYAQLARVGHALASASRLELLDLLAQGPRTVEALARHTDQNLATASHHLQVLRRAQLVDAEKAGLHVTYRLADARVGAFMLQLRGLAESRLAEIHQITRQYLETRDAREPIGNEALVRRVRAGDVTLIDVRPHEEYLAGHIPGALSIPVADIAKRIRALPKRRDLVAYCRGPYCVMALDAVDLLRRQGYRAYRMEAGIPEWRARGWRVEVGAERAAGGHA